MRELSGGSWSDIIATDWGVDIWDPPVYTQVIRWGRVSTYESKTKIYFGVWQTDAHNGTLSRNVQTNATANIVANVPQLQEKTTKYLNFLYLVINDL